MDATPPQGTRNCFCTRELHTTQFNLSLDEPVGAGIVIIDPQQAPFVCQYEPVLPHGLSRPPVARNTVFSHHAITRLTVFIGKALRHCVDTPHVRKFLGYVARIRNGDGAGDVPVKRAFRQVFIGEMSCYHGIIAERRANTCKRSFSGCGFEAPARRTDPSLPCRQVMTEPRERSPQLPREEARLRYGDAQAP